MREMPRTSPPTGAVTFLFTDVEGSSKLWEAHPEAMRAALSRHDALLRRSVEANGGHVFKTGGDSFYVAFASASGAMAAAVEAQRALHAESWPEVARIRVRMALHTGAAEMRDGDYFGATLNRTARLLALGHGGQSILSKATHDLCGGPLPAETTFVSLGEHGLRDLSRRETVFQVCHPDLPRAFPPLRTLTSLDESLPSIAVLPFLNMSRDEENEYFADGLAEELLNMLTKIPGLRVVSRTSAFYFKGKDIDTPTVARRLNVAMILEGSVRKSGMRVRIAAQLIRADTDSHLWSETYDRTLEDIFAVQDDIAQSVVNALRAELTRGRPEATAGARATADVAAVAKGRSKNAEAHQLYLQAQFLVERHTPEDTAKGIECYRNALALDEQYALAWAGLAGAYSNQAGFGWAPLAATFDCARAAAQRSLDLVSDLAEGHAELGWIRMTYDWDWAGADTSYTRALELAPGNRPTVTAASLLADNLGRMDAAVTLARRGVELDPLNAVAQGNLGLRCLNAGLLEEAAAALNRALKLNPQCGLVHWALGTASLERGLFEDALSAFQREGIVSLRLLGLVSAQHALGRRSESDEALRKLLDKGAEDSAFQIAQAFAYRGEVDSAFAWLERAYAQRDPGLSNMKMDPMLRNLHADPRWQSFLDQMGLTD